MSEPNTTQRFIHCLFGFVLGALIAMSTLWSLVDSVPWWAVGTSGAICAVLAFYLGDPFIEWLKESWWWWT